MTDFLIGINDWRELNKGNKSKGYSLFINGGKVNDGIKDLESVVREIKKYLRLRFKENLK